jgi:hypothetical protein
MPSGGLGDDEDTTTGASFGNVRQSVPLAKPADLQTALAPPEENAFGTKIYENVGLSDFTPAPVTRVGELLGLRSYFMSQFGPRYLWIIKLSMIEWPTLSAQEKQLHAAMRKSFVTSYTFGAEAILQHWLWKTLKNATKSFGPLLKVFATDYDATSSCASNNACPSKMTPRLRLPSTSLASMSLSPSSPLSNRCHSPRSTLLPRSWDFIFPLLLAMSAPTATL